MHRLVSLLINAAAIAAVTVSGVVLWLYWRRQTQALRPTFKLELCNEGNVAGRFELKADEPTGALRFRWCLNGTPLLVNEVRPPTVAAHKPAPAANNSPRAKVDQSHSPSSTVGQVLLGIGNLLPRSLGAPFLNVRSQFPYGQHRPEGAHPLPGRLWLASPAADEVPTHDAALIQLSPLSGARSSTMDYAPAATLPTPVEMWAQTPAIPPGGSLSLDLTIEPIRARHDRHYGFKVASKCLEQPDRLVSENGVVTIQAVSAVQRLLPLVIFAGIALLAFA